MNNLLVEQLNEVGGGKHLRLRVSRDGVSLGAIFFSATAARCGIVPGSTIEVAFTPQINEFRGLRSVQLNVVDLRPDQGPAWQVYEHYAAGGSLTAAQAERLLPTRNDFAVLWRYLAASIRDGQFACERLSLAGLMTELTGKQWDCARVQICLDVFRERKLLSFSVACERLTVYISETQDKVDLEQSPIMIDLRQQKGAL